MKSWYFLYMITIVGRDEKVLREVAEEIPLSEISSPAIQDIILNMKTALETQDDGVAIAAPQIGVSKRIFVVSGRVIGYIKGEEDGEHIYPDLVYINPKILKLSKEKSWTEEGCLSIRYLYGKVRRSNKVQIEAYDEHGKKFRKGATGLMAQIYQHETDHLDGILFIDKAKDVEDLPPEALESRSHKHV